jgi:hypothetical protein
MNEHEVKEIPSYSTSAYNRRILRDKSLELLRDM